MLHDAVGLEIFNAVKAKLDVHLRVFVGEFVVDLVSHARFHPRKHLVEVVAVYLDELAVSEARLRLIGLTRKVAEHADDERQFLHFDRAADLDIVGDLHARRAHAVEFVL